MRKSFAIMMAVVASTLALPAGLFAKAAPGQDAKTGSLTGTAKDAAQQNMSGVRVQVRPVNGTSLVASGSTNAQGTFGFSALNPGQYVVEIVDAAGNIVGTSGSITVAAGATASVSITAAAAGAIAAAGAAGASGLFGLGTIGTVAVVAGAGAVVTTAVVATRNDASPSR